MQLVAFLGATGRTWGVIEGDGIIELGRRPELENAATLRDAIALNLVIDIALQSCGLPTTHQLGDIVRVEAFPDAGAASDASALGLVIGNETAGWRHGRDPFEHVAGGVLLERRPDGTWSSGAVLTTRDEWDGPAAVVGSIRRALIDRLMDRSWSAGDIVPIAETHASTVLKVGP